MKWCEEAVQCNGVRKMSEGVKRVLDGVMKVSDGTSIVADGAKCLGRCQEGVRWFQILSERCQMV